MTDSTDSTDSTGSTEAGSTGSAAPSPAPAPRPGPRPGPGPSRPAKPVSATPTPALVTSDPSAFGRVDDDGTAVVFTADGERQIGSWQAGDAAEGLAHFGRRYDDLATEVSLLEARLKSGSGDAKKTKSAATALLDSLGTAAVIGDIAALTARLEAVVSTSDVVATQNREKKDHERSESTARKEALAAEAEQIGAESTQWKTAGDRLREILDEWKSIRGVDRKVDDALWKRYSKAREAFNRRRGAHFADLDRERGAAKSAKEELVTKAEALSDSTDWAGTAAVFRELLVEWKASGRAPRDADDSLWKRFKGAQDIFFAARNAAQSEQNAEFEHNAVAKEELLAGAESIDPSGDIDAAKAALRTLQDKWDAVGKVPRERMAELDSKLRAIEKKVRDAVDNEWRRTDPEALARAAQFRERVATFEEQAAKAEQAGKKKDAEKLLAQARQWREWAEAAEGALN